VRNNIKGIMMAEIDIEDVTNTVIKNIPSKDVQQAMLDEVKQRMESGESEAHALYNVFGNNSPLNKIH
jgi:hypothetical protein